MIQFILQTDNNGHRWEIHIRADGTTEYRREGRTSWLTGWPPALPSLKDSENK
jgi:hypothetical protein